MIMFLALAGVACAPFDCIDGGAGISYMRSSPDMACKISYTQSALGGTGEDGKMMSTMYYTYSTRLAFGAIALSCCIVAIVSPFANFFARMALGRWRFFRYRLLSWYY